ncbi:MAG: hypothetical protein BYD32DRAFT_465904 [Podila humilis]|nr:MAG: hypothetical protein BYD32DRAFT_465904 [Podila humilis]
MLTDLQLLHYLERLAISSRTTLTGRRRLPSPRSESHLPSKLSVLFPTCSLPPSPTRHLHWRPTVHSADESLLGAPVLLSPPMGITPTDVYSKLVSQSRGGHCLETNCLLGYAFQGLGFLVDRVAAKIVCDIKATAKRGLSYRRRSLSPYEQRTGTAQGHAHRRTWMGIPPNTACRSAFTFGTTLLNGSQPMECIDSVGRLSSLLSTVHVPGSGGRPGTDRHNALFHVTLAQGTWQMGRKVLESEQEQETCFKKYFGIEGYKQGALSVEV